jgi:Rrf2 family protein
VLYIECPNQIGAGKFCHQYSAGLIATKNGVASNSVLEDVTPTVVASQTITERRAMKLSRTVSYAVRATLQLAKSQSTSPVPCSQLAAEGDMPERFLLQILRVLVTHGILRSTRGVDGGYALTRSPDNVSLLEVIEAIDGRMDNGEVIGQGLPEISQNKLHNALTEVTATARKQLESIKLSHLLTPPEN